MKLNPKINIEECIGCGMCEAICEKVFEVGEEGYAKNIMGEIPKKLEKKVEEACENCPVMAISKSGVIKKIKVNKDDCLGCAVCEQICSYVFECDEEGTPSLRRENIVKEDPYYEDVVDAKECCPGDAIEIE